MAQATAIPAGTALWTLVHEQRNKVADMLATLSDAEWDTPSLCSGWRVRDVAAHCLETHLMTPARFVGRFVAAGFRFDVFADRAVALHASQSPPALLAQFRETAGRTTSPPGPKITWLGEAVIHGEDMARPVGRSIAVNPEALVAVAQFVSGSTTLLHGKDRTTGLRMRATDVDWSAGDGPEVTGPAAALIMAMTGRAAALNDLAGEGVATMESRMPAAGQR